MAVAARDVAKRWDLMMAAPWYETGVSRARIGGFEREAGVSCAPYELGSVRHTVKLTKHWWCAFGKTYESESALVKHRRLAAMAELCCAGDSGARSRVWLIVVSRYCCHLLMMNDGSGAR